MMSTSQEFKGLGLGVWSWPLINALLVRMRPAGNTERWKWVDWRGRERTIEVDRQIH